MTGFLGGSWGFLLHASLWAFLCNSPELLQEVCQAFPVSSMSLPIAAAVHNSIFNRIYLFIFTGLLSLRYTYWLMCSTIKCWNDVCTRTSFGNNIKSNLSYSSGHHMFKNILKLKLGIGLGVTATKWHNSRLKQTLLHMIAHCVKLLPNFLAVTVNFYRLDSDIQPSEYHCWKFSAAHKLSCTDSGQALMVSCPDLSDARLDVHDNEL